jgi:hypothetical protein
MLCVWFETLIAVPVMSAMVGGRRSAFGNGHSALQRSAAAAASELKFSVRDVTQSDSELK